MFTRTFHRNFTDTAINLSLTLLNAVLDLVSFSGILFSIYPPLFAALIAYSITGTVISIALGKVCAFAFCLNFARTTACHISGRSTHRVSYRF